MNNAYIIFMFFYKTLVSILILIIYDCHFIFPAGGDCDITQGEPGPPGPPGLQGEVGQKGEKECTSYFI